MNYNYFLSRFEDGHPKFYKEILEDGKTVTHKFSKKSLSEIHVVFFKSLANVLDIADSIVSYNSEKYKGWYDRFSNVEEFAMYACIMIVSSKHTTHIVTDKNFGNLVNCLYNLLVVDNDRLVQGRVDILTRAIKNSDHYTQELTLFSDESLKEMCENLGTMPTAYHRFKNEMSALTCCDFALYFIECQNTYDESEYQRLNAEVNRRVGLRSC